MTGSDVVVVVAGGPSAGRPGPSPGAAGAPAAGGGPPDEGSPPAAPGPVAGGGRPAVPGPVAEAVAAGAAVIAADSGLDAARALGLAVDLVVGDLDSVSPDALDAAVAAGVAVERHPEAKDATDLELALDLALARSPGRLAVVGSDGGRLDHVLATAALLASPRYASVAVEAWLGPARLAVVRPGPPAGLAGTPGELVTLLPTHGAARGVTTQGLLYPLRGEDLLPGSTRGVSNELLGERAAVAVGAGVVVAVLPGVAGTHARRGLGRPEP